jgi:hypothetical protein
VSAHAALTSPGSSCLQSGGVGGSDGQGVWGESKGCDPPALPEQLSLEAVVVRRLQAIRAAQEEEEWLRILHEEEAAREAAEWVLMLREEEAGREVLRLQKEEAQEASERMLMQNEEEAAREVARHFQQQATERVLMQREDQAGLVVRQQLREAVERLSMEKEEEATREAVLRQRVFKMLTVRICGV